ncbi:neuronal acetylcholine receptor subunit alpha-5-like [Ylistrum balloti]|uniref:neuronal acetylcholine receptor subunit alpha-5-like n=1 Tax=Ylistrum balloti TaxID=509963 RepID=UPI002905B45B|nr:neuronal acetylcholine receptor subunit alpha-5-like [Ylistrum balloti]
MRFIAWFDISWVDEFLILSKDMESLLIPKEDIWYPDLSIYDLLQNPQAVSEGTNVILFQNGRVSWYPGQEYTTRCGIDIRKYPFDVQKCSFRVGAWHNTAWTQNYVASENGFDISSFRENGEWEITDTSAESIRLSLYNNSFIMFSILLKRRPLHPVLNTLVPIILLAFLNTLVFLLPANSGEKLTLCVSVFLSFTVFLTVFNDTMPKMSTTVSYLSIYLVGQLGMSVCGIFMTIYIWRVKDREKAGEYEFVNSTSKNMNQGGIHRQLCTNNKDIKALPAEDALKTNGCVGDETDYRLSFGDYSRGMLYEKSTGKSYCITTMEKATEPQRSIAQLDKMMFVVTFGFVVISTTSLLIALII